MKKYLISLLVLVAVLSAVLLLLSGKLADWQQTITWCILGYFVFLTVVSHAGLERSTKQRPQVFVRYYMASTSIRLLAHLIVIISYAALNPSNARFFIIIFMIAYFVFTVFEVVYVMRSRV
jgi:hypothetical protein